MAEEVAKKPQLEIVSDAELDEDEAEFRKLRRDLPGVRGASAVGIVSINVSKTPGKNEFFRTHPEFRPTVPIVDSKSEWNGPTSPSPTKWSLPSLASAYRHRSHALLDGDTARRRAHRAGQVS
jgi:hypothetical protein